MSNTILALRNLFWIASGIYFLQWFFRPTYRVWRRSRKERAQRESTPEPKITIPKPKITIPKTVFTSKEISALIVIGSFYAPYSDADPEIHTAVEKCKAHVESSVDTPGRYVVPPFVIGGGPPT